jgi:hypothetical protein
MSDTPLARKKAIIHKELGQIRQLIKKQYPDAVIRVDEGPEASARSLWMDVFTDLVNGEDLHNLVRERGIELLVEKQFLLTVHALPLAYLPAPRARRANGTRVTRERRATYRAKPARRKEAASS